MSNLTHETLNAGDLKFVGMYVREILSHGLFISVNDGEEWVLKRDRREAVILAAMGSTDQDTLCIRGTDGEKIGSMLFVYGNDDSGCEVLADYSISLDPYISNTWAKAIAV